MAKFASKFSWRRWESDLRSRVEALEQMARNMQRDTEKILEMSHGDVNPKGLL